MGSSPNKGNRGQWRQVAMQFQLPCKLPVGAREAAGDDRIGSEEPWEELLEGMLEALSAGYFKNFEQLSA